MIPIEVKQTNSNIFKSLSQHSLSKNEADDPMLEGGLFKIVFYK
jgi:hypothetical protein